MCVLFFHSIKHVRKSRFFLNIDRIGAKVSMNRSVKVQSLLCRAIKVLLWIYEEIACRNNNNLLAFFFGQRQQTNYFNAGLCPVLRLALPYSTWLPRKWSLTILVKDVEVLRIKYFVCFRVSFSLQHLSVPDHDAFQFALVGDWMAGKRQNHERVY